MNEIICPHCSKAFKVDEAGYANILKQVRDSEFERLLHERLELADREKQAALKLAEVTLRSELQSAAADKDFKIQSLEAELKAAEVAQKLSLAEAVGTVEKERDQARIELSQMTLEKQLSEKALEEKYKTQIKDRDDMIERLRDLKARMSTKMIGETLEQHCETEFNRIRATAFPRAYFKKDNDARRGSKGDYIFRDVDESGTEIVSIMFSGRRRNLY